MTIIPFRPKNTFQPLDVLHSSSVEDTLNLWFTYGKPAIVATAKTDPAAYLLACVALVSEEE
jgi:hypothetical protein